MKLPITGYCILTETISGFELIEHSTDSDTNENEPIVYETELQAQKEIADTMITQLQQFIDDERGYDEVDWEPQDVTAKIQIDVDGNITVWQEGVTGDFRHGILETTLQEWRESL